MAFSGDRDQKADAMVDQAEDGLGLPVEFMEQPNFEHAAKLYFWFIGLIWSINLCSASIFELLRGASMVQGKLSESVWDPAKYYLGGLPYLTREESLILEIICLVILAVYTFFPISFIGKKLFWDSWLDNIEVILLVLLAGDTMFNLVYVALWGSIHHLPFRLAPYIRVLIVVVNIRGLRDCVKTLAGIIRDSLDIAALLLLFLMFSSWLAFILFEDIVQGKTVFKTFSSTLYQMSILYTTSNNPDVWLLAYTIFFAIYILFGVYFITNLVLAVVYDSFKGQLARCGRGGHSKTESVVFDLLDHQGRGYLDIHQCAKLFKDFNSYRTLPQIADEDIEAIFYALDDSGDFKINREEFSDLCNAISLKFDKADEPAYLERFPRLYQCKKFEALKRFLDIQNYEFSQRIWQYVEFALGVFFCIDRLAVRGGNAPKSGGLRFQNYWRSAQNRFDFIITVTVVVAETLTYILPTEISLFENEEWIRYLLIVRLLRLLRLLVLMERYQVMVSTFLKLIPSLMPYLGITFCLMSFLCALGVQIFGGIIYDGNPRLPGSAIADNEYWQAWMDGFEDLTGNWWSQFYFWSFYVLAVLFLFNLVVAFVHEAFFAEMEIHAAAKMSAAAGDHSSDNEDKTRIDPGDPRRKARRAKNYNVESLLNHMLSSEIEKTRSLRNT